MQRHVANYIRYIMKKLILILLSIVVCFALISCSCAKDKQENPTSIGSDKDVGGDYPDNWE